MRRLLAHLLSPPLRRRWRIVFGLYAAALFIGTHIPSFRLDVPGIERPDLALHLLAFCGWFGLFWLTGYASSPRQWRSIPFAFLIACLYAAADELLQGIPGLYRTVAWDDYLSNVGGIALGALIAGLILLILPRPAPHD